MDHHTTYLGQLRVDPPLGAAELEWLRAFAEWGGGPTGDPFDIPPNPRAEWGDLLPYDAPPRTGVPAGVRDWVPCDDGCHLLWRPAPGSNDALLALRFLVDHYLGPRALARGRGADFDTFTFDHRVDGVLAAHRDDTEELFLLRAEDGRFHRETLDPGLGRGWRPDDGNDHADGDHADDDGADGDGADDDGADDDDGGLVATASGLRAAGTVRELVRREGRRTRPGGRGR